MCSWRLGFGGAAAAADPKKCARTIMAMVLNDEIPFSDVEQDLFVEKPPLVS